jgi:formylglycine-generating enzyme required for sulfatase activity
MGVFSMTTNRPLRVFLCHSKNDIKIVRELYEKLRVEPWIEPWLDEENLYPGQDWNLEIEKAIETTDEILVCLSNNSITKEGYVQKEIKIALDCFDRKPEGAVFIIPVRLEECNPPIRLSKWHYADCFEDQRERGIDRLLISLKQRALSLDLKPDNIKPNKEYKYVSSFPNRPSAWFNSIEFMRVSAGEFLMGSNIKDEDSYEFEHPQHLVDIPYSYWITRFPITNEIYNFYVKANKIEHPVPQWEVKKNHPVVQVSWKDTVKYCKWLDNTINGNFPTGWTFRLPTEAEWEKAARGDDGRLFPWGSKFDKNVCNINEGSRGYTTPVGQYSPEGDSPYGCADMAGNVWEWTHSLWKDYPYLINDGREEEETKDAFRVLRGGAFNCSRKFVRCAYRTRNFASDKSYDNYGFRVVAEFILKL